MSAENLDIKNTTKGKPPRLPFSDLKKKVLGGNYKLSLVFIGDKKAQNLNLNYRKKDYPANVLSFPLEKTEGEIFINLASAKRDHQKYEMNYSKYVAYLFIHALLHLKGLEHGSRMNEREKEILNSIEV